MFSRWIQVSRGGVSCVLRRCVLCVQVNNASRGVRLMRLVPPGDKILEEHKKREEEERKKKKKEEEEEKSRDVEKRKEVSAALAAAQVKVRVRRGAPVSLVPHVTSYPPLFTHAIGLRLN